MKKMAIVTICKVDNTNFGNALQNFAVKTFFENMGFCVDTLCFIDKKSRYLEMKVRGLIHKLTKYKHCQKEMYWKERIPKLKPFERYYKAYCPHKYISTTLGLSEAYDYFAVGSDQVWNAFWYPDTGIMAEMYLLAFARPEQRICAAPSFGNADIPEKWKAYFAKHLSEFPAINVRERTGQTLIRELTGRNADIMIDPTLWFDRSMWASHAQKPKTVDTDHGYLLTYFLGGINSERDAVIRRACGNHDLKRYDLLRIENQALLRLNPAEFVYMIKNAKLVVTDSFHACVFSFLMGVPFVVCEREGVNNAMFSRIETLLETFHLQRKDETDMDKADLFDCDYTKGYEILQEKQREVRRYYEKLLQA